jgi:hypothetical protein
MQASVWLDDLIPVFENRNELGGASDQMVHSTADVPAGNGGAVSMAGNMAPSRFAILHLPCPSVCVQLVRASTRNDQ